jgi:hypothetical protein
MAEKKSTKAESASSTHIQWNVPDWRDASAYPTPDALMRLDEEMFLYDDTLTSWRWEFLRRRQDYRKDFDAHAGPTYDYEYARAKAAPKQKGKKLVVVPPDHPAFRANIEYLARASDQDSVDRFRAALPRFKQYGLPASGLPNPRCLRPTRLRFERRYGAFLEGPIQDRTRLALKDDEVMVQYCLSQPLGPQEQVVGTLLRRMQAHRYGKKVARRARLKEWPIYLRVLDARDAGVPFHVIGRELNLVSSMGPDQSASADRDIGNRVRADFYIPAYDLGINFTN